jgi:cytochrome c peroxidase
VAVPAASSPAASPDTSQRRWAWIFLAAVLLIGGAPAPGPQAAEPVLPASQEPISPIPPAPEIDPQKLALGESLFRDVRLSGNGQRSCASCHDPDTNGASGTRFDKAPDGTDVPFNSSTVFNAALSFRLNWEGGARTLQEQAETTMQNPQIMAASIPEVLTRLRADPAMVGRFRQVYGDEPQWESLIDAIAAYERTMVTPDSRFDHWLRGDADALSIQEQNGYQLFKSLGCISCHQGVNVGGNLFERHGIFHPLASPKPRILRVPSLRNVATTPPYFHDGSAPTLEDAVTQMGNAQLDQTLTDHQVSAIVAFLRSLTGTYRGRPVTAAAP